MDRGKEKAQFRISLAPLAFRNLERLLKADEKLARRISERINSLSQQPMLGKPLTGIFEGRRSLRIGRYRVIYRMDTANREILIVNVGHRRDIYDR